ncbi:hypothetical protein EDB87DRAFT_759354 [Lactarius vividus]|nr:hypothetical protein EDB87DRAFT_759354 [Lactarius vividus]
MLFLGRHRQDRSCNRVLLITFHFWALSSGFYVPEMGNSTACLRNIRVRFPDGTFIQYGILDGDGNASHSMLARVVTVVPNSTSSYKHWVL